MTSPLQRTRTISTAAAVALLPALAFAHAGADAGGHHGFLAGLAHPLTGLDHLAAMLAIGLWSALATRRWWLAPLAFAALVLAGALLATAGLSAPAIEPAIATSLVVLGLLVARRAAWPPGAMVALAGTFALFHGAAHGQELSGAPALAGMVLATALLHTAGLALGFFLHGRSPRWPRVAGLAASLFGAVLLVGAAWA